MGGDSGLTRAVGGSAWRRMLVLGALFVLGFGVAWAAMPTGPWLGNDSLTYVGVARNIDEGQGVTSPFAHELSGLSPDDQVARLGRQPLTAWPPGYSIALAAGAPVSVSAESMARLLGALSLGAVLALTAVLVGRLGGGLVTRAVVPVVLLTSLTTVLTFTNLASEPVFVTAQTGALVVLLSLVSRVTWPRLAGFVTLAIVASSTRFVGVSVVLGGALTVALFAPVALRRRWLLGGGVAVAGLAPTMLWILVVSRLPGFRGGVAFASRWADLTDSARSIGEWFVPHRNLAGAWVPVTATAIVLATAVAVWGFLSARPADPLAPTTTADAPDHQRSNGLDGHSHDGVDGAFDRDMDRAPGGVGERGGEVVVAPRVAAASLALPAIMYVAVLLFSASFLDHEIPIGGRLLVPLAPTVLALLGAGITWAIRAIPVPRTRPFVGAAVAALALASAVAGARYTYDAMFVQPLVGVWVPVPATPARGVIDRLGADVLVFTNQPSALYASTGRPVLALPRSTAKSTGRANPELVGDLDQLAAILRLRPSVVAIRKTDAEPYDLESALRTRVDLQVLHDDGEYRILGRS